MEFLKSQTDDQLLRFLHLNRAEMSSMEDPQLFLDVLRDHELIPEDQYKKLRSMKRENIREALYDFLDWFEKNNSKCIRDVLKCAFKETSMSSNPTLKKMMEKLETTPSSNNDEGAGPSQSSPHTPSQNQRAGESDSASTKERGEKDDIGDLENNEDTLSVKCGNKEGTLVKAKLAKGEKCIEVEGQSFTPIEFQVSAGKHRSSNWKDTIKFNGIPLGKLIEDGHLKAKRFKKTESTSR